MKEFRGVISHWGMGPNHSVVGVAVSHLNDERYNGIQEGRPMYTSTVQKMYWEDNKLLIETLNSIYELEIPRV